MIKKKNILTILITICFVINSLVSFASNVADAIEDPSDELDPPPSPIDDFIIPMIVFAFLYVSYTLYKNNLIEKSASPIN